MRQHRTHKSTITTMTAANKPSRGEAVDSWPPYSERPNMRARTLPCERGNSFPLFPRILCLPCRHSLNSNCPKQPTARHINATIKNRCDVVPDLWMVPLNDNSPAQPPLSKAPIIRLRTGMARTMCLFRLRNRAGVAPVLHRRDPIAVLRRHRDKVWREPRPIAV